MPGCVVTVRFSRSISRIAVMRVKAMVSAPSIPAAPPDSPEPAPRGNDRDVVLAAQPDELDDLGRLGRQRHGEREPRGEVGGLVAAVRLAVGGIG